MKPTDEAANAALFDTWADTGRAEKMALGHRPATDAILDRWTLDADSIVVDVGCGNGWALRLAIGRGAGRAIGVDVSPGMVERARATLKGDPRYRFEVAGGASLPLAGRVATHVLSVESLYYHPDPGASLREWARVARPGARLGIMIELYGENPVSAAWQAALDVGTHLLGAEEWAALARRSGWRDVTWRQVRSTEPPRSPAEFVASPYWPDYATYLGYHAAGSLVVEGER